NRVLRMSRSGKVEILCDRPGGGPEEIRQPNSFCRAAGGESAAVWLVDKANHRLQGLDSSGRPVTRIGRCGLDAGGLLYPVAPDRLSDGSFVISQHGSPPALTLLAPDGEELGFLPLDYTPAGVLALGGRILVAQHDSSTLRVYQRR